jgi:hypothetical protein
MVKGYRWNRDLRFKSGEVVHGWWRVVVPFNLSWGRQPTMTAVFYSSWGRWSSIGFFKVYKFLVWGLFLGSTEDSVEVGGGCGKQFIWDKFKDISFYFESQQALFYSDHAQTLGLFSFFISWRSFFKTHFFHFLWIILYTQIISFHSI